jgi:menaquinone-dependent protoporphyrinogen oxidase
MIPNVLVVYASSHGQTRFVAEVIATELRGGGAEVVLCDAGARTPPAPTAFDAIVVGSRIHFGRMASSIRRYVAAHRVALGRRPVGLFSVSMRAVGDPDGARAQLERFADETGLRPTWTASFAGALRYRSYGWPTRLVMKRISASEGHATDTSHDHDYTDAEEVGRFGERIASALVAAPHPAPMPPARLAPTPAGQGAPGGRP